MTGLARRTPHCADHSGAHGLSTGVARRAAAEGAAGVAVTGDSVQTGSKVAKELAQGQGGCLQCVRSARTAPIPSRPSSTVTRRSSTSAARRADRQRRPTLQPTDGGVAEHHAPELFDQAHHQVNLKAPLFIMSGPIRHLKDRGAAGNIVNIVAICKDLAGRPPYLAPYARPRPPRRAHPECRACPTAATNPRFNRIKNIGWTATEASLVRRRFHGAGDDWLDKADASVPMGELRPSRRSRRFRGLSPLHPKQSGDQVHDRLGPERPRRLRLTPSSTSWTPAVGWSCRLLFASP